MGFSQATLCTVLDISVQDTLVVAEGASFGDAGEYEYIYGNISGSLDPADIRNSGIVNIQRADADESGRVAYTADFALLRPVKPVPGGGKLLIEAPNRGRKYLLQVMNDASPPARGSSQRELSPSASNHPVSTGDIGNGFLLRQGYTLAWVGWEQVGVAKELMSAELPEATGVEGDGGCERTRTGPV